MADNQTPPDGTNGRAIVTFARSYQALAAVQSLGRQGVEVVVCDEAPMAMAQFSKYAIDSFVHPPMGDGAEAYLDGLEENIRKFRPSDDRPYVLMPIYEGTRLLAEHAGRFKGLIELAAPQFEAIEQVDPKHKLMPTAEELGLPIPRSWSVGDHDQLEAVLRDIRLPAFLKLPHKSGGIGMHRVETADELRGAYVDTLKNYDVEDPDRWPLIQEAVGGQDYCVTVLFQHGQLKAHHAYRNVKTYPWAGGSGAIRETVDAPQLISVAETLLGSLNWHGVAEVDFLWDGEPEGEFHLIEVNPRFWGGLFQSIASGVDYPWMLYQMIVSGEVAEAPAAVAGTRTQVPLFGIISAIKDINAESRELVQNLSDEGVALIRDGDVGDGLQKLAESLQQRLKQPAQRMQRLAEFLEQNEEARTEIFSTEDPQACLGVLFGLAGLIHNGELPEQFRRRSAK